MKKLLHVVLLMFALTGPALAGPYEDGEAALRSGDYVQAHMWFYIAYNRSPTCESFYGPQCSVKSRALTAMRSARTHMTPAQITESNRRALAWQQQHPH